MNKKLIQESCENFSELLAAKISVPGGGGAAALTGSLGAALGLMVANFTVGKKKYAEFEDDIKIILMKVEKIRLELLELVDEDAENFAPLAEAYAIPKENPERDNILESALLNACKAPMKVIELCSQAVDFLNELLIKGSRLLISDVGCGAYLCVSSMKCAAMNVFINTSAMKDRIKAQELEARADELIEKYSTLAEDIASKVSVIIRRN